MELEVLNNQKKHQSSNDDDDFSDLSACERCVADGGGCCTGSESGIFTTMHDLLRIHDNTGLPLEEIGVFAKVDPKHEANVKETDPFLYEAYRNGKVLQLKRSNGYCQFLKDVEGCKVFAFRPMICKLFPFTFDFTQTGELRIVIPKADRQKDEDCTILAENYYRSKGANLRAMNSNAEVMMRIIKTHVEEIKLYKEYVDDLNAGMPFDEIVKKHRLRERLAP